jgi:hypothetical protein
MQFGDVGFRDRPGLVALGDRPFHRCDGVVVVAEATQRIGEPVAQLWDEEVVAGAWVRERSLDRGHLPCQVAGLIGVGDVGFEPGCLGV